MDRQKVVKTVLGAVLNKGQEEVSSLIGQPVEFSDSKVLDCDREAIFEDLQDQQVLAELKVEGDREGTAWMMADFRDALTLGGTLIMLPDNELQERIEKGSFGEDEADAFGEIVNILTGVMSGLFDELFPDKLRFVKTELNLINPLQVAAKEDYPFPEGPLKVVTGAGTLQDKPLSGQLQIVVPATLLGLEEAAPAAEAPPAEAPAEASAEASPVEPDNAADESPSAENPAGSGDAAGAGEAPADAASSDEAEVPIEAAADGSSGGDAQPAASAPAAANANSEVSLQKLKKILAVVHSRIREEVGGFLGHTFDLKNEEFCKLSREEAFTGLNGTHVLAHMSVEGDRNGEGFLLVDLNAAIRLGGTLIMLPDSELDSRLESGEYGAEDSDAFGEIVNIVAGIYTAVFNDLYPGNLRFVKTEQETLDPLVIEAKGEYPMESDDLFIARGDAFLNDKSLGQLTVIVPVDVLGLKDETAASASQPDTPGAEAAVGPEAGTTTGAEQAAGGEDVTGGVADASASDGGGVPAAAEAGASGAPQFFVYGQSEEDVESFIKAIEGINLAVRFKNVQDGSSEELLAASAKGVFLVMDDVGEQGIAAAIKIHAAVQDRVPLIAAGPNWTRSMVLRAIKYGIQDILVTPASEAQIQEKVRTHMVA